MITCYFFSLSSRITSLVNLVIVKYFTEQMINEHNKILMKEDFCFQSGTPSVTVNYVTF